MMPRELELGFPARRLPGNVVPPWAEADSGPQASSRRHDTKAPAQYARPAARKPSSRTSSTVGVLQFLLLPKAWEAGLWGKASLRRKNSGKYAWLSLAGATCVSIGARAWLLSR
jgi:hypothetical protein